jgi:hypothetical protein
MNHTTSSVTIVWYLVSSVIYCCQLTPLHAAEVTQALQF